MIEQRLWPRVPAIFAVDYEYFIGSLKLAQGQAHTVNMSGRGLAFETRHPLQQNGTVILWLTGPRATLHVRGVVIHSRPTPHKTYLVGVALEHLIEGEWDTLTRVVDGLLEKYSGELHA